jgi:F-type H+-transporting ATPase subunit gamma
MEDPARLQSRIASLDELRHLFSAMQAIAASHVQAAHVALDSSRRYAGVVERAIAEAACIQPISGQTMVQEYASQGGILIVICSEHGFAGAFNRLLLERAKSELTASERVGIVGRRGASIAEEHAVVPAWTMSMATHVGGIPSVARRVASRLKKASNIRLVRARGLNSGRYEVEVLQLLPVNPKFLEGKSEYAAPLHQLDPRVLLQRLIAEHFLAEITLAMMESLASENGARLRIMQAADRNIADRSADLTHRARQFRQEAITSELLDVVTGAEAVLQSEGASVER